jgi:trehalose/maltose hydrolase-like predicted phosphorylase
MSFNLGWQGRRIEVALAKGRISLRLVGEGDPVEVLVHGDEVQLRPDETVTVEAPTQAPNGVG